MEKTNALNRTLAVIGTVFVWLPVLAPALFSAGTLFRGGPFRFDYLMPAELAGFVLLGGVLLLWAALRTRAHRALIGGGLALAVAMLAGGQALAVVTGLASGDTEPAGLPWALVLGSLVLYDLAVIAVGVGGALLLRDLFRKRGLPLQGT